MGRAKGLGAAHQDRFRPTHAKRQPNHDLKFNCEYDAAHRQPWTIFQFIETETNQQTVDKRRSDTGERKRGRKEQRRRQRARVDGETIMEGPKFAWLNARTDLPAYMPTWNKSENAAGFIAETEVISGVQDERAEVIIVGGGPHALAALAALHDDGLIRGDGTGQLRLLQIE